MFHLVGVKGSFSLLDFIFCRVDLASKPHQSKGRGADLLLQVLFDKVVREFVGDLSRRFGIWMLYANINQTA